jgi:hypothetical protein
MGSADSEVVRVILLARMHVSAHGVVFAIMLVSARRTFHIVHAVDSVVTFRVPEDH